MTTVEPDGDDVRESDLVYEPAAESPLKRWVLLDGDRTVIAAVLAVAIFATTVAAAVGGAIDVRDADAVGSLIGALVGGTLPFITIVLAINQLVLSQELGWTDELQTRLDGMTSFRREVEALTDVSVSPVAPADFLRHVVEATVERAEALTDCVGDDADPQVAEAVQQFAEALAEESRPVADALEDVEFGTFDALAAVLGHHQGTNLHVARRFRVEHAESFVDVDPLDELVQLLEHLAVARQTFKTLYVQYELAVLSRRLLYVGFPTLVGGGLLLLAYPQAVEAVGDEHLLVGLAATGVTLVFLPFVVLLSSALRIATIAARTADFGPYVPRR